MPPSRGDGPSPPSSAPVDERQSCSVTDRTTTTYPATGTSTSLSPLPPQPSSSQPAPKSDSKTNPTAASKDQTQTTGKLRPHHQHHISAPVPAFYSEVISELDGKTPASKSLDAEAGIRKSARPSDSNGLNLLFTPADFVVKTHGAAGRIVQKMGIFAYALFFVVPLLYVALFFAIIPLGDPLDDSFGQQWVFLLISNVCVTIAIGYLYNAAFLTLADCERPFRTSLIPLVSVVVVQIAVMAPILLTTGTIRYSGIVVLAAFYITLFASMYFAYSDLRNEVVEFFKRFMLLLILYIPLLCAFVIGYRETESSLAQSALSFAFAFLTFIYRRVMLSRLDPYPIDSAQLFAGFWVQNLGDCTVILAFPQVNSPSVFAAVFISNSAGNIGFLFFVSNLWIYRMRPWLKTTVKNAVKCNFPLPEIPPPDESFDPMNRGHDFNVGGYRRRQFRFFFFRLLSQSVAMFMYLGISPILRYGVNAKYTPLAEETGLALHEYRNSMIYAASNLGFIAAVGFIGYYYLKKTHKQTFSEIKEIHLHDLVHHTMVGMVTAIITQNMIVTIAIILSHYCIFASFSSCRLYS